MKSHSEKAAIASFFTYTQFLLALTSGVVLFPLVVNAVGNYSYGLWLATGEAISYVLLGDLGVFAVLPWLIAASVGANDMNAMHKALSNALGIGLIIGTVLLVAAVALLFINPSHLGFSEEHWNEVLYPMVTLLVLNGLSYPLRAFNALMVGVQDVVTSGWFALLQSLLLILLTIHAIKAGTGIQGLAIATGVPPFIVSILSTLRVFWKHSYALQGLKLPDIAGCHHLLKEGFGAWLGGIGFRLMVASNGIILTCIGHPEWGTIYASTGKIATILSPLCSTLPDSSLVAVSHVHASQDRARTANSVVCLIFLYVLLPTTAGIGLLIANPAFVHWWISPALYAGDYVNVVSVLTLMVSGLAGGLVKLVSVVGHRQKIGWTTIIAGVAYLVVGFTLVKWRGLAGLAEAGLLVWSLIIFPVGVYYSAKLFDIDLGDFKKIGLARWIFCTASMTILAGILGHTLIQHPLLAITAGAICSLFYLLLLRPMLEIAPWPMKVKSWLGRLRLTSRVQ